MYQSREQPTQKIVTINFEDLLTIEIFEKDLVQSTQYGRCYISHFVLYTPHVPWDVVREWRIPGFERSNVDIKS